MIFYEIIINLLILIIILNWMNLLWIFINL